MGIEDQLGFGLGVILLVCLYPFGVSSSCSRGCDLALASYIAWQNSTNTLITQLLNSNLDDYLSYNPQIPSIHYVLSGSRVNVPFSCNCIDGDFLGHVFSYSLTASVYDTTYNLTSGNTYDMIAKKYYSNLTTTEWLQRFNSYPQNQIPDTGWLNVTVNCSCGDSAVSNDYGLFLTYPLRAGESLHSVAGDFNLSGDLLQRYNPNSNFSSGEGLVYIPVKDINGTYIPLQTLSKGISGGAVSGISIGAVIIVILLVAGLHSKINRKKRGKEAILVLASTKDHSDQVRHALGGTPNKSKGSNGLVMSASPGLTGISIGKSVNFSYEELAKATNDFSLASKIGEGGFGSVYYAELRGEKAAIKKMDTKASKFFFAELKVLTHVHHLHLVCLIGYCVTDALFIVYEYIENGNLSDHMHGSGRDPLPWPTRVQIALDSARGLEYIHEHTICVYIHRDIKSANILIDKNYRAKVADFGLAKLAEVGNRSRSARLVGTFGYMPPEYAKNCALSPKIDVFAFGVVLFELISAKKAIFKAPNSNTEPRSLVALFNDILDEPDSSNELRKVIDPRLGDHYPLDAVLKMAQLAKACTHENPQVRPSMRKVVIALTTLSSTVQDWDVGLFYENQAPA